MAGNPKKRARAAAEAAEQAARAAQSAAVAATLPLRPSVETIGPEARTHARAQAPRTFHHVNEGQPTRQMFDRREANDYDELTQQLQPGITCRLIRTRPSWAAGWLEDIEIDDGNLTELFEHLRTEHGGLCYQVQLIGRDNRILYKSKVPIAGAVRRDGKPITRAQWDGEPEPERARRDNPQPTAAPIAPAFDPMSMLKLVLDMQDKSAAATTRAIEKMQEMQTAQTETLITAVMQQRSDDRPRADLSGQLNEFVKVTSQVDKIRASLTANQPQPSAEPIDPIRQATADIFKTAIQNEMFKGRQPAPQPSAAQQQPQRRRRQPQPNAQQPQAQRAPVNGQARRPPTVETIGVKPGAPMQ